MRNFSYSFYKIYTIYTLFIFGSNLFYSAKKPKKKPSHIKCLHFGQDSKAVGETRIKDCIGLVRYEFKLYSLRSSVRTQTEVIGIQFK